MSIKLLLLLLLELIAFQCKAQYQKTQLELQTDSLVAALQSQGVDTVGIVETYCVGCVGSRIRDDSPCATKGILVPTYILWQSRNKTYAAYIDNCSRKVPVVVLNAAFWIYLNENKEALKSGKIKPFSIIDKSGNNGAPEIIRRNHGGHVSYKFILGRDTINQYFDTFALTKKTHFSYSTVRNIYYRSNKSNPIWKLNLLIAKAIREVNLER